MTSQWLPYLWSRTMPSAIFVSSSGVRPRIGLAIGTDVVDAVLVGRDHSVKWHRRYHISEYDTMTSCLTSVLTDIPELDWLRPTVSVAIRASYGRVKHLRGLPTITNRRLLTRIVTENIDRFFIRNGAARRVVGVRVIAPGEVLAAALAESVIDSLHIACAEARLRLRVVVPSEVCTGEGLQDHTRDDRNELTDQLKDDERYVFDAYAAAHLSYQEPVAVWTPRGTSNDGKIPTWRFATAWLALIITLTLAVLTPGLAARHSTKASARELASLARIQHEVSKTQYDLDMVSRDIDLIASFSSQRESIVSLLASISDVLPSGSAITTIHFDSSTVDLAIVSLRASAALDALDGVAATVSPEIVGPVTHELVGQSELERATIRLGLGQNGTAGLRVPYAVSRGPTE